MAEQTEMTPQLLRYVRDFSLREDDILRELRRETAALPAGAATQVAAEEGQFLALLIRLARASSVLEIGTFTGYSTLCMARALPSDGHLVTCDVTDRWPAIGAAYWRRAGVEDRIELRVGDAARSMEDILSAQGPEVFDVVFIDADKSNYPQYWELSMKLVRPGGLVVVDDTLFFGRVANDYFADTQTEGVREINALVRDDDRVDISMLPIADGITLARRRER